MANNQIHRVSPELTNDAQFKAIRARCVPNMEPDPYTVLGVKLNDDFDLISHKKRWM